MALEQCILNVCIVVLKEAKDRLGLWLFSMFFVICSFHVTIYFMQTERSVKNE